MTEQTTGGAVSDYDAVGGGPAVSAVVSDFYERVLGDPQLAPYFDGGGRRYSARDIALLREVQRLSQEEGVNLAGIKRIIELEQTVDELRARLEDAAHELMAARAAAEQAAASVHASYRRDLVPVDRNQAIVVWRPKKRD